MLLDLYEIVIFSLLSQYVFGGKYSVKPNFSNYCKIKTKCKAACSCELYPNCSLLPMDETVRKTVLFYHNQIRDIQSAGEPQPSGMTLLQYDMQLEDVSKCWAARCDNEYSICFQTPKFKETSQAVGGLILDQQETPNAFLWLQMMSHWLGQAEIVSAETIQQLPTGEKITSMHNFAQLMSDKVRSIGCAWSILDNDNWLMFVCTYGPRGSVEGEPIYKTGTPCSHCPKNYSCDFKKPFERLCKPDLPKSSTTWSSEDIEQQFPGPISQEQYPHQQLVEETQLSSSQELSTLLSLLPQKSITQQQLLPQSGYSIPQLQEQQSVLQQQHLLMQPQDPQQSLRTDFYSSSTEIPVPESQFPVTQLQVESQTLKSMSSQLPEELQSLSVEVPTDQRNMAENYMLSSDSSLYTWPSPPSLYFPSPIYTEEPFNTDRVLAKQSPGIPLGQSNIDDKFLFPSSMTSKTWTSQLPTSYYEIPQLVPQPPPLPRLHEIQPPLQYPSLQESSPAAPFWQNNDLEFSTPQPFFPNARPNVKDNQQELARYLQQTLSNLPHPPFPPPLPPPLPPPPQLDPSPTDAASPRQQQTQFHHPQMQPSGRVYYPQMMYPQSFYPEMQPFYPYAPHFALPNFPQSFPYIPMPHPPPLPPPLSYFPPQSPSIPHLEQANIPEPPPRPNLTHPTLPSPELDSLITKMEPKMFPSLPLPSSTLPAVTMGREQIDGTNRRNIQNTESHGDQIEMSSALFMSAAILIFQIFKSCSSV